MVSYKLNYFQNPSNLALVVTVILILTSVIVPFLFRDEFLLFGRRLLTSYRQGKVDFILYFITMVSSSPAALPVWTYAAFGSLLGYEPVRLILVMSLGSMTGSSITYFLGRYFGTTGFVKRNFPDVGNHPWTRGRSIWVVSLILFGGAVSPIPFEVMYAACGMKRFPIAIFSPILFTAWAIKLSLVVFGFKLVQQVPYLNLTL